MNNIVDEVFSETVEYLKRLGTRRYFSKLLERYVFYYNKGIYVHFNFISNSDQGCFECFERRYGLESFVANHLIQKKPRDTRMKIYDVRENTNRRVKACKDAQEEWYKVRRSLESNLSDSETKKVTDSQYNRVQKALRSIYEFHEQSSKEKLKRAERASRVVYAMDKHYKNASEEFKHAENLVLALLLEFYMTQLSKRIQAFFGQDKVIVRYPRKEIVKLFKERNNHNNYDFVDPERQFSVFERELLGFMDMAKKKFIIQVSKENFVYKLTSSETKDLFRLSVNPKGDVHDDPTVLEPLEQFLGKYAGFRLLIHSMAQIKNAFGDKVEAFQDIVKLTSLTYSKKFISRYMELEKEYFEKLKQEREHKPKWMGEEQAIQKMKAAFPAFQISSGMKEDSTMNFVMEHVAHSKERFYIHFIDSITNGTEVLKIGA
ncbi:hypothetical protein [Paenibacillus polymyxa]|uniref:Uncharacterized protein n=1 Tax=Paenibacillus polymyxa (strain SC2) TaxID=886882 RepID=E3EJQ7_PAEPS|nr:hypothetical protein [Paenibacillus polymyxa]ADO59655.1 hypothetical protein PPSC2_26865 [Paenibacillus polymyxa SC2]WPQ59521.1 hypothetical protein SKN87_28065 [Paenibacillus polymyxa]